MKEVPLQAARYWQSKAMALWAPGTVHLAVVPAILSVTSWPSMAAGPPASLQVTGGRNPAEWK